jgi:hypothetical protein
MRIDDELIATDASRLLQGLGTLRGRTYDHSLTSGRRKPSMQNYDGGNGGDEDFNPDPVYEERFPRGADIGFGPDQGFNVLRRLNDASLFTEEALQDPVIRNFVDAPFTVTFAAFKSSTREAEWFLHKPHRVLRGEIEGIDGSIHNFTEHHRIGTFVINHERTLALRPTYSMLLTDDNQTGQVVYKGPPPDGS